MWKRIRHPLGWVCLFACFAIVGFSAEAYAQSSFLQGIENKAVQVKDGIVAIVKVLLVVLTVFYGVQVARGDRDAWSRAIGCFIGVILVFQADNIIGWLGAP